MIPIIGPLIDLVTTGVEKFAEHKKLKQETVNEIERAKIRRIESLDMADANWDTIMADASRTSWKDEYWTVILSIPAILAFFPSQVDNVLAGFAALNEMPDWYRWALGVAIAAAFGYRKLTGLVGKTK